MSLGVNSGVSPPTHNFKSFCQQITAGIFVSIENTATLANMGSLGQGFFDNAMTRTALLASVLRWNGDDNFAKYLSVVLKPFKELSPCSVTNALSETTILDHVTHSQFLKHHQIVRFDHASCQFHKGQLLARLVELLQADRWQHRIEHNTRLLYEQLEPF